MGCYGQDAQWKSYRRDDFEVRLEGWVSLYQETYLLYGLYKHSELLISHGGVV